MGRLPSPPVRCRREHLRPGRRWRLGSAAEGQGVGQAGPVAPPGSRFTSEYDFGDSWEHDIVVEKVLPRQADKTYPVCLEPRGIKTALLYKLW
ncbi:MAG: IS1096 element passenger TnpR family protein, partial [Egibacteraceae bacterium]